MGRDPATLLRSANMALAMTEDPGEIEKAQRLSMARLGADEAKARDTVLGGSVGQIRDTLGRLAEAGVGMLFIPTVCLPRDRRPALDRFITEVAPAFRAVRASPRSDARRSSLNSGAERGRQRPEGEQREPPGSLKRDVGRPHGTGCHVARCGLRDCLEVQWFITQ